MDTKLQGANNIYPGDTVQVQQGVGAPCTMTNWKAYSPPPEFTGESFNPNPTLIKAGSQANYSNTTESITLAGTISPLPVELYADYVASFSGDSAAATPGPQQTATPCTQPSQSSIHYNGFEVVAPPSASPTPPSNPTPSPTPPTGFKIGCNDQSKTVGSAFATALSAHPNLLNAPAANSYGQELYGYIYKNDASGIYYHVVGNNGEPVSLDYSGNVSISPPDTFPGYTYVGWYHTHPNIPSAFGGVMDDQTTGLFFSSTDIGPKAPSGTAYVAVMTATIDGGPVSNQWFSYSGGKQSSATQVGSGKC